MQTPHGYRDAGTQISGCKDAAHGNISCQLCNHRGSSSATAAHHLHHTLTCATPHRTQRTNSTINLPQKCITQFPSPRSRAWNKRAGLCKLRHHELDFVVKNIRRPLQRAITHTNTPASSAAQLMWAKRNTCALYPCRKQAQHT